LAGLGAKGSFLRGVVEIHLTVLLNRVPWSVSC
jgi:hypothetical protein